MTNKVQGMDTVAGTGTESDRKNVEQLAIEYKKSSAQTAHANSLASPISGLNQTAKALQSASSNFRRAEDTTGLLIATPTKTPENLLASGNAARAAARAGIVHSSSTTIPPTNLRASPTAKTRRCRTGTSTGLERSRQSTTLPTSRSPSPLPATTAGRRAARGAKGDAQTHQESTGAESDQALQTRGSVDIASGTDDIDGGLLLTVSSIPAHAANERVDAVLATLGHTTGGFHGVAAGSVSPATTVGEGADASHIGEDTADPAGSNCRSLDETRAPTRPRSARARLVCVCVCVCVCPDTSSVCVCARG